MRCISLLLCYWLLAFPAWGATKADVTLYLDGAKVEREATAVNGTLEITLPVGVQAGSLRVKPIGQCVISRVEVVPSGVKESRVLELLNERRAATEDRLKALGVKEEIFIAAARAQSGKAPRKTKANPEPLAAIRQGTEFAIARLEAVYAARRRAERELRLVDKQLAAAKAAGNIGGSIVRIRLAGKGKRVLVSWQHNDLHWTPFYDFRLTGNGQVEVSIHAQLPPTDKYERVAVALGCLTDVAETTPLRLVREQFELVGKYDFPVTSDFTATDATEFSFSFTSNASHRFPAGDAAAYWRGEYLGQFRFAGCGPGENRNVRFGFRP
jgi:hypothetical protein